MPITKATARRLCTKSELELFEWSLPAKVKTITPGRLAQKIKRARNLRNKYAKLADQQEREARGKGEKRRRRPSSGNENTRLKEQLFQEALDRFTAQQTKLEGAGRKKAAKTKPRPPGKKTVVRKKKQAKSKPVQKAAAAKKKATAKKTLPKARKTKPKSRVSKTSTKTNWAAKQRGIASSGRTRSRTHVSARGRRQQARRDSRGGR